MDRIRMEASLADRWYVDRMGRGRPDPVATGIREVARYEQERSRLAYEELGEFGIGSKDPTLRLTVPQHDGRNVIAAAFGASHPEWDGLSGSFRIPGNAHPLSGLRTAAEVEALPLPDWDANPLVRENRKKWEEFLRLAGPEESRTVPLNWTELHWSHPCTGARYRMSCFPTFLDLGSFLMGTDAFLMALASDPELSRALLSKFFRLSAGYAEAMRRLYARDLTAWGSLGGDNSCLVSPGMYREYAMAFDGMVRGRCGDLPRNLHSCGASAHLYGVWAGYPERERIVLMQTRAVPGAMKPLRVSLPRTYVQLTIHQPQFDFEGESPERVKDLVWDLAEAMEFRDASLTVLFTRVNAQSKDNLTAFFDAGRAVNEESARRG